MTDPQTPATIAEDLLADILPRLKRFLSTAIAREPNWNDGEHAELAIRVGFERHDEKDREVWVVTFREMFLGGR